MINGPEFSSANIKNQLGDLVVEPICVNKVTQADAVSACENLPKYQYTANR